MMTLREKMAMTRYAVSIVWAAVLAVFLMPGFSWAEDMESGENRDSVIDDSGDASAALLSYGGGWEDADYTVPGFVFRDRDRYKMSCGAAQGLNDGVIVVSGDNFPDALAASGLAGLLGYPIVYTPSNGVGDDALQWISRYKVHNVLIIGGDAAVSKEMEHAISDASTVTSITRIAGNDRFETADAVYRYGASVRGWGDSNAVVVSGNDFADAASVAVYAAREAAPVFLADSEGALSGRSLELASSFSHVLVAGGDAVVSETTVSRLSRATSVDQFAGADRYETSAKICEYLTTLGEKASIGRGEFSYSMIYFATGTEFADALAYGTNSGVEARWSPSGPESAAVVFLVDGGKTSSALDVLRAAGTYCESEWPIERFGELRFIGYARFEGTDVIDQLACNGFGIWCDFNDGQGTTSL